MPRINLFLIYGIILLASTTSLQAAFSEDTLRVNNYSKPTRHGMGENSIDNKFVFKKRVKEKSAFVFPETYDLRTVDGGKYLSEVKNQGSDGTCWTFATMGAVESYWLKQGAAQCDLSERNLATCHGFDSNISDGGNIYMSVSYFARLLGPVSEMDDPYTYPLVDECQGSFNPVGYVTEARFLPGNQSITTQATLLKNTLSRNDVFDKDLVKKELMENGALYVNMYIDENESFYNPDDFTYYYCGKERTNHAILLVGWDDNKIVTGNRIIKPKSKGAWICRNSWGTNWGDNGYFYISYEDTRALTTIAYFPSAIDYKEHKVVFQYDNLGFTDSIHFNKDTIVGLVEFKTLSETRLTSVGLFIVEEDQSVDIEIYKHFDGNSLSGLLGNTKGVAKYPGYYSFDLPDGIVIPENDEFFIKISYFATNHNTTTIAIENGSSASIELNSYWLKSDLHKDWLSIGRNTDFKFDLCIKAYGYVTSKSEQKNQVSTLSIDNKLYQKIPDIKVYPNPAENVIYINWQNKSTACRIEVSSIDGCEIVNSEIVAGQPFDISFLKQGIYFLKVETKNSTYFNKLIKL